MELYGWGKIINSVEFALNLIIFWTMDSGDSWRICIYRVAQKSKPPQIFQKIVLKIANEIRFLRKVEVWIKHYNKIRW